MNIASPAQATIVQGSKYFRTQSPTNPTHFFSAGNTPGFTYVRDICAPGDTSAWLGPYVMGAAKTDGGEFTTGVADKEEEQLMLQLFPNPNSGNPLIVKTAALGNSATLAIYNLQGDLVANHP